MVTLTFVFDKEKVSAAGKTEDELLAPMREHAKKYGISENELGVFSKEGEEAYCVVGMSIPLFAGEEPRKIDFLRKWILNVDGEEEDCLQSSRRWLSEHNRL
jgi:hypothetical protein